MKDVTNVLYDFVLPSISVGIDEVIDDEEGAG